MLNPATDLDLYDTVMFDTVMRGFYGGDWYNVGLWDQAGGSRQACTALVASVAARVARKPRRALDVGCGVGGSTRVLSALWPEASVIGLGISQRQLDAARQACPGASFVRADAVAAPFADAAFDAVIAVESALHFETRAAFLKEARRLLAPGGVVAVADLLVPSRDWPGSWSVPQANLGWTVDAYAEALTRAGLVEVVVEDVTALTWDVYLERFSAHVESLPDDGVWAWRASANALRSAAPPTYVIASARAPERG